MSIETPKINRLYPERASSDLDMGIIRLQEIEDGKINKLEIPANEKIELLSFENDLGEELEQIVKVKNISTMVYIDYLLTDAGREDFQKAFGIDIGGTTPEDVKSFLYFNRDVFLRPTPNKRTGFSGRARDFANNNLLNSLLNTITANGEINTDTAHISDQVYLSLNPEKTMNRLNLLRNFKNKLKAKLAEATQLTDNSAQAKARLKILDLYKKKVNQLLAGNLSNGVLMKNLADCVGLDNLTPAEKDLLGLFNSLSSIEKKYSRSDKFIRGATTDYNDAGYREQISQEILDFANTIQAEYITIELNKEIYLREKGLDPKKIFERNITYPEFSAAGESLLRHYDNLSEYPATDYDPDGIEPAPDNKWRFVARPEITEMSIASSRKAILAPQENQSIETMITVLCGHEIEGHFIQNLNIEKIPLKLLRSNLLGGDRAGLFSEGGAMMIQNIISQEAFGFQSLPKFPYVQAMLEKLKGGNYFDCVKVLYNTKRIILLEKKVRGDIDEPTFKIELRAALELAINRAKRLFNTSVDKSSNSVFLTQSGETVYLEQLLLMRKLQQQGMEKYAFIRGVNLNTLADLAETGLFDLSQIKKPDLYSLEIWNKIKDNYKLDTSGTTTTTTTTTTTLDKSTELL